MPKDATLNDVLTLIRERDAQLVEVLPEQEFKEEHLPGAINISLKKLSRQTASVLDPDRPIITYCWDDL
ncbi:MAG: rhodanese-like domain-containing protein [Actinomycetota bacterium]|nr:rhodanese-like domain-containing protein [Actinomycetota bacterium]